MGSRVSPFLGCGVGVDSQSVSKWPSVLPSLENKWLENKAGLRVSPFLGCDDGEWNVGVDKRDRLLISWFVVGVRIGFESKECDDVV